MPAVKAVAALIPAFNEEKYIFDTVRAVLTIPEIEDVLVVDDGSLDDTAGAARRAGARVLSLPANGGKGEALNHGAAKTDAEVVVLLDADLGSTAGEARRLIIPVLEGRTDLAIAIFPESGRKGGFGLVKRLAGRGIKLFTGLETKSPLSGQRAMTREVLRRVTPFAAGFGVEVALTVKAVRAGFRLLEVPVMMGHRDSRRDARGFLHRGKQFWDVTRAMWELRN
ncbi:MAG: glycosyltransferase family 2 protein [Armatimonadetes bacterium]|nr:glycosyltransferase family 2 protein [Armatimonadota bacterium]